MIRTVGAIITTLYTFKVLKSIVEKSKNFNNNKTIDFPNIIGYNENVWY